MTQYARPSSDVSAGSWTTSPLYAKIDEVTPSDVDFIQCSNANSTCEIALSSITDPSSSSSHTIKVRARKAGNATLTVYLFDGTTQIASWSPSITTSFAEYTYTLTSGEADNIGDYTDLRLKFQCAYVIAGGTGVSWADFEVPDAGTGTSDSQDAYLDGQDDASDNQSVYIKGSINTSDDQDAYLAGGIVSSDDQDAYTHGGINTSDNQDAFLHGGVTATDNQPAYTEGSAGADVADNQSAYLEGATLYSDSQPAFMDTLTYFPFTDNFTGTDGNDWNDQKWLTEVV